MQNLIHDLLIFHIKNQIKWAFCTNYCTVIVQNLKCKVKNVVQSIKTFLFSIYYYFNLLKRSWVIILMQLQVFAKCIL